PDACCQTQAFTEYVRHLYPPAISVHLLSDTPLVTPDVRDHIADLGFGSRWTIGTATAAADVMRFGLLLTLPLDIDQAFHPLRALHNRIDPGTELLRGVSG